MKIKVTIDGNSYEVDIEDIHKRPVIALIEGELFEVTPEEVPEGKSVIGKPVISAPGAAPSPFPIANETREEGNTEVRAPLPGVIDAILVKPGDRVSHSQQLCTLEAMKMKNAIRASREGVIASVEVSVGDQVNHGQVLMKYEG